MTEIISSGWLLKITFSAAVFPGASEILFCFTLPDSTQTICRCSAGSKSSGNFCVVHGFQTTVEWELNFSTRIVRLQIFVADFHRAGRVGINAVGFLRDAQRGIVFRPCARRWRRRRNRQTAAPCRPVMRNRADVADVKIGVQAVFNLQRFVRTIRSWRSVPSSACRQPSR